MIENPHVNVLVWQEVAKGRPADSVRVLVWMPRATPTCNMPLCTEGHWDESRQRWTLLKWPDDAGDPVPEITHWAEFPRGPR